MSFSGTYWITFGIGVACLGFFLYQYNRFTRNRIKRREALHNIDLFLKRQSELLNQFGDLLRRLELPVPPEIESARQASARAYQTSPIPGKAGHLKAADQQYYRLIRQANQYPQAQRRPDFSHLLEALEKNAAELQGARRYHNALVRDYNIRVETMPSALAALTLRFKKTDFLTDSNATPAP
ncbi:MAG: LemA family protein [Bacteroidota bacterium]